MTITSYTIRAASADAIHAALVAASAGKERTYAWGVDRFDEARVQVPFPEMVPGEPVTDAEGVTYTPQVPTGYWLCTVALVDETDADLAPIAV